MLSTDLRKPLSLSTKMLEYGPSFRINGHKDMPRTRNETARQRVGDRVSLFKVPGSPNWYISYSVDRRQYRRSTRTRSKKRAETIAKERDAELVLGRKPHERGQDIGIPRACEKFLAFHVRMKTSAGTIDDYKRHLEQFAAYAAWRGVHRLRQADADLLEEYELKLEQHGLKGIVPQKKRGAPLKRNKSRTVRNKLKSVRQLINWALKRRHLHEDPSPGYVLPRESDQQAFCWKREEVLQILNHSSHPWRDLFEFFLMTGLRSNELCWLLKEDLHAGPRSFVRIRAKECPMTGVHWKPKHGRERIVPLVPEAVEIVKRAMRMSNGPWLFWSPSSRGPRRGQFRPRAILAALHRAKKAAGISQGVVHTWRHVFCAFAANRRVSPFKVMKILGHGSLDIVLRYYHVDDDELLDCLNELRFDEFKPANKEWKSRLDLGQN